MEIELVETPVGKKIYSMLCHRLGTRSVKEAGPAFFEFGAPVVGIARVRIRMVKQFNELVDPSDFQSFMGGVFYDQAVDMKRAMETLIAWLDASDSETECHVHGPDDFVVFSLSEGSEKTAALQDASWKSTQFVQTVVAALRQRQTPINATAEQ